MTYAKPKPLDIRAVVEHYGGHIPTTSHRGVKMKCFLPGHEDSQPSAVIYEEKGYYRCFTCDTSLDGWAVIMRMESCDFKRALTIGAEQFDGEHPSLSGAASQPRRRTPLRISQRDAGPGSPDDPPLPTRGRARRKRVT